MGLIPDTKSGKIGFFNARVTPWTDNATQIGTTAEACTDLQTKLTNASDKLDAQLSAQSVAKAAVAAADSAVAELLAAGMDIIKQIRIKGSTGGPDVYELAQIPAPATPAPVGPPGTVTDFAAALRTDGALLLKWKCNNPVGAIGTIYQLYRTIDGGTRSYIGGAGKRQFIDASVPAGAMSITYTIQATRTTAVGVPADFLVKFGTDSGGVKMVSVVENGQKATKVA